MKRLLIVVASLCLTLQLAGCGGGGADNTSTPPASVTGQFVDSFVANINYTCSSGTSGVTSAAGEFTCLANDTVEFFLGTYSLGSCTVQETITPYDLYPDNDAAAVNVAQLLQTIDTNADPSDGITVPANLTALNSVVTSPADIAFETTIATALGVSLVGEAAATAHLNAPLTAALAGKTLYTSIYDQRGTLEQWVVNAEATEAVYTELVGGNATGTSAITIRGMEFIATDAEDGAVTFAVEAITADYIVINAGDGRSQRLYYNRAAAETYFGVTPTPPDGDLNLAGLWQFTETQLTKSCGGLAPPETYPIYITQQGSTVTASAGPIDNFTGTLSGSNLQISGESNVGGITTVSMDLTVAADAQSVSGNLVWNWTDGTSSCSGTSTITGAR